jgi:hypothetical protein
VDAKPFLRLLTTGTAPRAGSGPSKDFDVDLKANLVAGYNNQTASNVTLRMGRRSGQIRLFNLNGKFGKDNVLGSVVRVQGEPQISLATNDGGALLTFFDLYKRMEGGKLQFTAQLSEVEIDGTVTVQNFIVRNEPALRRLVSEGVAQRDRSGQIKIDTTASAFTKMQVSFTRAPGSIELRDGVIYGPEAGTTIEGTLDTVNDRVNLTGTFVPAYGLNNLFSKIPLFADNKSTLLLIGGTTPRRRRSSNGCRCRSFNDWSGSSDFNNWCRSFNDRRRRFNNNGCCVIYFFTTLFCFHKP